MGTAIALASIKPVNYEGIALISFDYETTGEGQVEFSITPTIKQNSKAIFIKNVKKLSPLKLSAEVVSEEEVAGLLTLDGTKKPLFCIHGLLGSPNMWLNLCQDEQENVFNKVRGETRYNLIPVLWPGTDTTNVREVFPVVVPQTLYPTFREDAATSAQAMKQAFAGINDSVDMDVIGVSMGTWVLKEIASNRDGATPALDFSFDNIFMSAADVPGTIFEEDDGKNIIEMLSEDGKDGKVYVFHNKTDGALLVSSSFDGKRRLGLDGATAEGLKLANGKVKNIDVFPKLDAKEDHGYLFYDWAAEFYQAEPKPDGIP